MPDNTRECFDNFWYVVVEVMTSLKGTATSAELDETIELLQYEINAKSNLTPLKGLLLSMGGNKLGAIRWK